MVGVFFISHIYNDFTLNQYNRIKKSLLNDFELIWVTTNNDYKDFFDKYNIKYFQVTPSKNYYYGMYKNPNSIEIFLKVYNKYNNYIYYWFIEYDVVCNNLNDNFLEIFKYFHDKTNLEYNADVICDHLESYHTNFRYNYVHPYQKIFVDGFNVIKKEDVMFGFFSICRISNNFFAKYTKTIKGYKYFFEWGIPTFANKHNLFIVSFKNIFTDDTIYYNDAFYNHPKKLYKLPAFYVNIGTNSWNIDKNLLNLKSKNIKKNYIIHPIKTQEEFDNFFKE